MQLLPGAETLLRQLPAYVAGLEARTEIVNLARDEARYSRHCGQLGPIGVVQCFYFPISAIALLWSRDGAQAFIEQAEEIYAPFDILTRHVFTQRGTGLALKPALITQASFESEIDTIVNENSVRRPKPRKAPSVFMRNLRRRYQCYAWALRHKIRA